MVIIGVTLALGSSTSGAISASATSTGCQIFAPAGDLVKAQSYLNNKSKYPLSHCVGLAVQGPSMPLVVVSRPTPEPWAFFHPNPICSIAPPSGSAPTSSGSPAPCALPNVWPPATKATVSSSFIAIRPKVSRISCALNSGSGLPFGPSGFT